MKPSRGPRRILLAATAAAALGLAFVLLSNAWIAHTQSGTWVNDASALAPRDIAIVPGTAAWHGRPYPMLRYRLNAALELLRQGRVRSILVSGNEAGTEVTAMRNWLEQRGVAPWQIISDGEGTRTIETMRRANTRYGVSSAVVCTQELYMNRTLYLARQSGIDAVGFTAVGDPPRAPRFVIPEMAKSALAFLETLGSASLIPTTSPVSLIAAR